jgi:hypothetical protein
MKKRVLFICGSMNQTTQLHAVARELDGEIDAFYTPFYGDRIVEWMRNVGLLENTIGGNKRRGWTMEYLAANGCVLDMHGSRGGYDLFVNCTDLVVPKNTRGGPLLCVQEGIFEPDGALAAICRGTRGIIPRWVAGTALTGESFLYDRFCVASEGYRQRMIRRGADPGKVVVTGIPNFDDCERYRKNNFPHKGYVLVCTSDLRETFQGEDRPKFIRKALGIAGGRQLVFKLHPNEDWARARREIEEYAPGALVYQDGSAEEMIANCDALVTQWSSTVFVGMALGKEVYSNFSREELEAHCPWQNGGSSAGRIAAVCRELIGITRPDVPAPRHEGPPRIAPESQPRMVPSA